MTERKIATSKPAHPKKVTPARKAVTKKAPAGVAMKKVPAKTTVAVEKKLKKTKKTDDKIKMVRDSFSMPQSDYAKIAELKQLCQKVGLKVKKSELLRAGLDALGKLSAAQLKVALSCLEK